jgi:predicted secreted hydrolase
MLWAALVSGAPGVATPANDDSDAQDSVKRGRALRFPRDHGAHPASTIEWWYATGWLGSAQAPLYGFQVTFFRSKTGLAAGNASRFAARQLLFAHAALTDLRQQRHQHSQRLVRWSGRTDTADGAALADADVRIGRWRFQREGGATPRYLARIDGDFAFTLALQTTQPLMLQGDAGFSRKGPDDAQSSHYYSEPQLQVSAQLAGSAAAVPGRAWLDHEWSEALMHPEAVGWDWIGINLHDGSALMAFQMRRADGSVLWAGGGHRVLGQPTRSFAPQELRFTPGRRWKSPATGVSWPLEWTIQTPLGRFELSALLDAQELDNRQSTGTLYWEGVSRLRDESGRDVGLGYLELTGYGAPLKLG